LFVQKTTCYSEAAIFCRKRNYKRLDAPTAQYHWGFQIIQTIIIRPFFSFSCHDWAMPFDNPLPVSLFVLEESRCPAICYDKSHQSLIDANKREYKIRLHSPEFAVEESPQSRWFF